MEAELKERILKLLREDLEFRYAVAGLVGLEEVLRRLDESTKAIRSLQEQVAENTRAIRSLQEQVRSLQEEVSLFREQALENAKALRALQEQVAEYSKAIRSLQEQVAEHTRAIRSLQEQVAEHSKAIRSLQEQVAENTRAIRSLQEQVAEHGKILERHSEAIRSLQEEMRDFGRILSAIGARWGVLAEEAFRRGMVGIVEKHFGGRVQKWSCYDEEGEVYGHPSVVEADLLVTDREHVLVEIKSSASKADVYELWYIGRLYEKKTGIKPRLVVVSPFVDERAKEAARRLGVEIYAGRP